MASSDKTERKVIERRCAWCERPYGYREGNYPLGDSASDGICRECSATLLDGMIYQSISRKEKEEILETCQEALTLETIH
ncbi:MAG: hypothetical protein EHM36_12100 [Deltaproteobacteria bacterium]|nr:MAG: hypothetical protein EHM36_12100 [Deltaproteobacteria bacterium]